MSIFANKAITNATQSNGAPVTDTEIVAARTDERIHIKGISMSSSASTTFTLKSGASIIFSAISVASLALEHLEGLKTAIGENLNVTTSAGSSEVNIEFAYSLD